MSGRHAFSSPATVYKHVQRLVQKGYLRKTRHQGRGIEIVDDGLLPETLAQLDTAEGS